MAHLEPGGTMRRREFIGILGGAVAAWPLGAFAQQRDHPRRIGVLMGFAETDDVWQTYLRVFQERLRELGWTEGQNVRFEYRFAGESAERTRLAAAELVSSKPDLLFVTTIQRCQHFSGKPARFQLCLHGCPTRWEVVTSAASPVRVAT